MKKPALKDMVLGQIESKGITPKPRWHFLLREGIVWSIAVGALLLGIIATALTMYIADSARFILPGVMFTDMFQWVRLIPIIWLILGVVGVFYTIHALRDTRRGYVWSTHWLVLGALALSVGLGATVYGFGLSERLDTFFLKEVPLYGPLSGFYPAHWMNPDSGVYVGMIVSVTPEQLELKTIEGALVQVLLTEETRMPLQPGRIQVGMPARVFGTTTHDGVFTASDIRPFMGRGRMLHTPEERMGRGMGERGEKVLAPRKGH